MAASKSWQRLKGQSLLPKVINGITFTNGIAPAIVEEFKRPSDEERRQLFQMDTVGLSFTASELNQLVAVTGIQGKQPGWTFSDIRTRLYPAALALAFPSRPLAFGDLIKVAGGIRPSPVMEDK
eukprot:gene6352-8116_t